MHKKTNSNRPPRIELLKDERARSEYGRSGIPIHMPAPLRFIYGYFISNPEGKHGGRRLSQYGPVAVRLKPELREFALQMPDASLRHSDGHTKLTCRPTFFDSADRRCWPVGSESPFKINGRKDLPLWHEAQILGVDREDIQEVVFHTAMAGSPFVKKKLTRLLGQYKALPQAR